ncbi:MAG: FAD:protein FMN transferase [bacterium]
MKKVIIFLLSAMALLALSACSAKTTTTTFANPNETYCAVGRVDGVYLCSRSWIEFYNTTITLTLYVTAADHYDIAAVFTEVETILRNYHRLFDRYHVYDGVTNIRSLNLANDAVTVVGPELFDALGFAVTAAADVQTEGVMLFNPALGPVLKVWHDARENPLCTSEAGVTTCPVPSAESLAGPFSTDLADLILDPETRSVAFAKTGMELDLGGFGKGYVAEIITDWLDEQGIRYLFNGGNSNVKAGGVNPNNDTGYYYIALKTPAIGINVDSPYFVYLQVAGDLAVVTSGMYQNYFLGSEDSVVYHHIIDPRTYRPGGEAMAVTIILENGALGDVYSTAIFLLDIEDGITFVDATPGLEAVWYLDDGTVRTSSGFAPYVYEWLIDLPV